MPNYIHVYDFTFEVKGSTDEFSEDVTEEMIATALFERANRLIANDELLEAVGDPFDTYDEAQL